MALQSLTFYSLAISLTILCIPRVYGQINAPCTASMLTSFNPCMSFLTSVSNVTQPPPGCCNSISSLMGNGSDCFCQIATGNIFFRIPINRTLAFSLPRACNMPNVTLQCKTSGSTSPAPAPGPAALLANVPGVPPTLSPSASAPGVDSTPSVPPPITSEGTTSDTESPPPSQTPPASPASFIKCSPLLLVAALGAMF